jgi:hypothetical protein
LWESFSLSAGIFFGRNNDVTFGVTYGFMDQIDFFFERVKNGKYMREVETTDDLGNKVSECPCFEFLRARLECLISWLRDADGASGVARL